MEDWAGGEEVWDQGPAVLGALWGCGMRCGLPRRVLGPAGGCDPSPRAARCHGSRYGKRVQECCFCLEPLSRSNGASKPLTQSCSCCLWSHSRAKCRRASDTVPYGGLVLAGAAGARVAALLHGHGVPQSPWDGSRAGLGALQLGVVGLAAAAAWLGWDHTPVPCPPARESGSAVVAVALVLCVAAERSEQLPALCTGRASPRRLTLCSSQPSAVSPAQDADSLPPRFPSAALFPGSSRQEGV